MHVYRFRFFFCRAQKALQKIKQQTLQGELIEQAAGSAHSLQRVHLYTICSWDSAHGFQWNAITYPMT